MARPRAEWRRVGDLRPTADPFPPNLIAAGLPVLASTRSLLHRERTSPDVPSVPAGRVSGLTSVFPAVDIAAPAPADPTPARAVVVARAHRTVTLTRAVAEYVGEARVPDVPYRAPAWLRAASAPPQVITPLDAFVTKPAEDTPSRAPVSRPSSLPPEVTLLDSWSSPPPPAVVPAEPAPSQNPLATPVSLVESPPDEPRVITPPVPIRRRRRPGLGLPLPPGERPPAPAQPKPAQTRAAQTKAAQAEPGQTKAAQAKVAPLPAPPKPALVRPAPTRTEPVSPEPPQPPELIRASAPAPVVEGAAGPELVHRTVPGRFSARIPNDLAETFERSYGVDVTDVTVDRSPAAAAVAKAINARAYAHHDLIVLPEETGPVESVETRAMLGHELAHIVQQRTVGSVPTESDVDGQRLEAAARSVEQWVRSGAVGPPPPAVPPAQPPPRLGAPPNPIERSGPAPVRRRASSGPPSGAGAPQRAPSGVATDPAPTTAARTFTSTAPSTTANNTVSTSTAPTLVHPRTPTTARPTTTQDDHDPWNPRDAHEFRTLVRDSFAEMGADVFGIGSLLQHHDAQPTPQPNRPTTSTAPQTTASGQTTTSTGQSNSSTPTFNRDARRQQLISDRLDLLNGERERRNEPQLAELPATELEAIERQLDVEAARNGGAVPGTSTTEPVIEHWSDVREQLRLGGGELLGGLFGINPVDIAERERHRREDEAQAQQQQQSSAGSGTTTTSTAGAAAAGAAAVGESVGHPGRPATPEPTGAEMARLYDRIHTRLIQELLVGRERAGSLMDFR